MKIAVIIPVYNEQTLLPILFDRLVNTPPPTKPDGEVCDRVIYLVDDGSKDDSPKIIEELAQRDDTVAILQPYNQGKGAALQDLRRRIKADWAGAFNIDAALRDGLTVSVWIDGGTSSWDDDEFVETATLY